MVSTDDTFSKFSFPPGATAPLAERLNRALLASDSRWSLRPYCFVIDTLVRGAPEPRHSARRASDMYARWAARCPSLRRSVDHASWRGDVVIAGECAGRAELELIARLIDGIAASGRSILYLST